MHLPRPTRWRAFATAHYRPFQAIAVGQAFTASYASDALFVPLLLRLGAPPALVVVVGAAPLGGAALQAFAPQILRRLKGNLRGLTLGLALAEVRGFVLAAIVAGVAAGALGQLMGIALITVTVAIGQTAGVLSGSNISLWTAVVLPDAERRLVGPRMGALTMALSTVLLLPAGFALDAGTRAIGLWAYVAFFIVGGMASTLTPLAVARLPHPGRVLVARETAAATEVPPVFRRFTDVSVIAYFGQGLIPSLSLYALSVLGMSAGFAVALSGVAAAGALAGSLAAGSFLLGGSSSRVLRASFLFRAVAAVCCVAAIPANPLAPAFLLVGSALFNGAGNAGALATNERLYRLAPAQARVHCQSRFVGATAAAAGTGAVVCATALALAPPAAWAAYTALYAGSAISRTIATFRTEVSPSWSSPSAPPIETAIPGSGAG
jgi:MFS family permease